MSQIYDSIWDESSRWLSLSKKETLRLPLDSLIPKNGIRLLGVAQGEKEKG
jgi:hypothetical protein